MLNIVFMGTPDFAKESLKCLVEAKHNILAVVTNPDMFNAFGCESLNNCHYSTIISFVNYFFEKFLIWYNLKVFTPNFHPTENHGCFDA